MGSPRFRERNSDARKEGRSKGLCSLSQLQRKKPNDQNIMKVYQRNKKVGKEAPTSQLRHVETSAQKRKFPKVVWVEKGKIVANQTIAMTVDPTGKKGVVSSQSMKCPSQVEKEKKP